MFVLLFLFDDRRIRTTDRTGEAQKHTDPDPKHWSQKPGHGSRI
jgi:hypothetical protein